MLARILVILCIFAASVGEQDCTSGAGHISTDDVTSLLQNHIDVARGASRSKPGSKAAQEVSDPVETGIEVSAHQTISTLEKFDKLLAPDVIRKGLAEFVAMTLFVFIGCGSAMTLHPKEAKDATLPAKIFHVSLVFGFAITALAYSIGHYSGGQINCAVSFGLVVSGHLSITQALVNTTAQLLGSICGSLLTLIMVSPEVDKTGGLGTNAVNTSEYSLGQALLGEIVGTFLLVFVVHETAISPETSSNRALACLAIGIAVFLAHSVLIPIDGCSINPARSFGPMIVRAVRRSKQGDFTYVTHHWIFWLGPMLGAFFAGYSYKVLNAA